MISFCKNQVETNSVETEELETEFLSKDKKDKKIEEGNPY